MPILNMVGGGKKGGNIGEPLNLTVISVGLDATITWEDNEIGTIPPTSFQKSELVRKIGSAPTSPSDGDLVVTETVKDTYKTTGYVDQGLTDGTTYYYRVFSYSDLGGISYCDAVSVTPSTQWQPGANTVAYYPLDSTNTVNDMSGNNYTLSGTGSYNFDTYQGVDCCYISDGQLASSITSQALPTHTGNIRYCEVSTPVNDSGLIMGFIKDNAITGGDFSGLLRSRTFPSYMNGIIACIDDGAAYSPTSYPVTTDVWINVCYVYDNGAISCYVNGVLISSFSYTWSVNYGQMRISRVDQYDRSINGYVSNAIFENKARTAQEIEDYYNLTKSNYGIS